MADDFARQLLDALYNPETQPPQQPSRPLREKLAGAAETVGTLGSGLLASVPAGLAGLTQLIPTRGHRPSVNRAAEKVEEVQSALTRLPRTEAGQEYLGNTVGALGVLGMPAEFLGEQTLKLTGSPFLATVANVGLDPVNYIGMPGSGKAAVATGKALGRAAAAAPRVAGEMAQDLMMGRGRIEGQRGAVKMKGGNWVSGSVESMIEPLKQTDPNMFQLLRNADPRFVNPDRLVQAEVESNVLDKWLETRLARYIRNEMGTPEDPLRQQADEFSNRKAKLLAEKDKQLKKATDDLERAQAERGVPAEVLTRSQARIRDLKRERDYIEAQTGLHFEPAGSAVRAHAKRKLAGTSTEPTASSAYGSAWEDVSDASIVTGPFRDMVNMYDGRAMPDKLRELGGEFAVKNPDAQVHQMDRATSTRDLGFDHLSDELLNALDPNSGLPPSLLLTPEKLEKMSVPQAVKLVDEINAWRAVQKREADAARAANEATSVFKEYPDQGLRWVELKLPEPKLAEGHEPGPVSGYPELHGIIDRSTGQSVSLGATPEEALRLYKRKERQSQLEDALKYEGEMLSHCVGGYCDRVLRGDSRIMSLRDAEGRPRITVELQPDRRGNPLDILTDEELAPLGPRSAPDWLDRATELANKKSPPQLAIKQIKSKGNKLASEEDIPYVLDFLNSQPFGRVSDLPRSVVDLKDASDVLRALKEVSPSRNTEATVNLFNSAVDRSPDAPRFMTVDQLRNFLFPQQPAQGLRGGGSVHISDNPDTMALALQAGGVVKALSKAAKPTAEQAATMAAQRAELVLRSRAMQELKDQFENLPQPPKGFLSPENILQRMDEIRRREATPSGEQIPLLKKGGGVEMQAGGALKAAAKAAERAAKAAKPEVLTAAERDANLAKMLQESKAKTRLYHGTKAQDEYADEPGQAFKQFASSPTWLAQEPYTAQGYAGGVPGSSIYQVYAQVKNPLNLRFDANEEASKAFPMARRLGVDVNHIKGMSNPQWAWEVVNHPSFIDAVEKAGYDAIMMNEGGYKTFGVLDPRRIKSATGNRGTFDVTNPDITKKRGGKVSITDNLDTMRLAVQKRK